MASSSPHIVVIGGGTGSFAVLSGLKSRPVHLTALISMADDGGSTGTLRDELGVLPPGDIRQALVALSSAPQQMRNLFNFRFEEGGLAGHSFGNLLLSAVEKMTNNFGEAVRVAGEVLRIRGQVMPITLDNIRLSMELTDGTVLRGQRAIDDSKFCEASPHPRLFLDPAGHIAPDAEQALYDADSVVIAPGDLYTSLGPLLIVDGVAEVLAATKAKILYVCNLVVKPGHTSGFTVANHVAELERLAGVALVDSVIYNTARPSAELLEAYAQAGELMVPINASELKAAHYTSVGCPLVADKPAAMRPGDALATAGKRSFIRHDAEAVAEAIMNALEA